MNRIVLALSALVLVQLVNGQTACLDAQTALTTDATCLAAFSTGTDVSAICMGSCRTLFDNIIDDCDAGTALAYTTIIDTLCGGGGDAACTAALTATPDNCVTSLTSADSAACSGTCQAAFTTVATACASSTNAMAVAWIAAYATVCSGGGDAACTAALAATPDNCVTSLTSGEAAACSGTCQAAFTTVATACASSTNAMAVAWISAYSTVCSGGDSAACTAALAAIAANTQCENIATTGSISDACTGQCRPLLNTLVTACRGSVGVPTQAEVNRACGGSGIVKAFGVFTLLVMALSALIF